ncbi:hypothetical protein DFP73DRAFT_558308 [Morchella snyderi]|nr:hypothetical protein DFP73DRAFT_558308 [Morchella snyderi]
MVAINRFTIFIATISTSLLDTSLARSLATKRQTTTTDLEDLCSRRYSTTTVVGDRLYINGGQNLVNSSSLEYSGFDSIQYIDLSSSWKINAPPLNTRSKPDDVTNINEACAWSDGNSFFQYGGWQLQRSQETFRLWELDPSTSETSWKEASTDSSVNRLASGGYTNAPKIKKSYAYGGFQDQATTSDPWYYGLGKLNSAPGRPDIIEFDWETKATRNVTFENESGKNLSVLDNSLVYVPVGGSGILIPFSGRPTLKWSGTPVYENMISLAEIQLFDIASSTWYSQAAVGANSRGDIPSDRVEACSVVQVAPDKSSFNIYVFGGSVINEPTGSYNDLWILSLPSFKWIKVYNTADSDDNIAGARTSHTCQIIGNRQMAVIGGASSSSAISQCQTSPLFVFDMSSLSWKSEFDPSEAAYVLPKAITDVIGGDEGGNPDKDKNKPSAWTNPAIEKIFFTSDGVSTTSQDSPASSSSPSSSSSSSGTSDPASSGSSGETKSSTPAVVGGVVGGLLALLAGVIGFLFMRRRRRQKGQVQAQVQVNRPMTPDYIQELGTGGELHELGGRGSKIEYGSGVFSRSTENLPSPTERAEMP